MIESCIYGNRFGLVSHLVEGGISYSYKEGGRGWGEKSSFPKATCDHRYSYTVHSIYKGEEFVQRPLQVKYVRTLPGNLAVSGRIIGREMRSPTGPM